MADIEKKKDINQYTHEIVTGKVNKDFKGKYVNRKIERENDENVNQSNKLMEERYEQYDLNNNGYNPNNQAFETEREKTIRIFKLNSSRILHERNKYVFLASVAERAISLGLKLSDVLGFMLIKKLFKMLCYLRYILQNRVNDLGLDLWDEYVTTRDFKKISNYIRKEFDLFKSYYENLNQNVKTQFENNAQRNELIAQAIEVQNEGQINQVLRNLLQEYLQNIFHSSEMQNGTDTKDIWIHMNELLDCLNSEKVFYFDMKGKEQFNFKLFYQEVNSSSHEEISKIVKTKLALENFGLN